MNLFNEHPEIFANGKFNVQTYTGHEYDLGNFMTLGALKTGVGRFKKAKLIARPISRLSDEELDQYFRGNLKCGERDHMKNFIIECANQDLLKAHELLHLLSIGCYPGSQSDFEDGTVIKAEE